MVGEQIASLRKAAGMSQAQLASRLKISSSAVGMYEQGRREPSIETLVAIAELFHVTIDFLVTGKTEADADRMLMQNVLLENIAGPNQAGMFGGSRLLSREELAVLFAAMMIES